MKHIKDDLPRLFSLAMRTNPFDEEASPVIESWAQMPVGIRFNPPRRWRPQDILRLYCPPPPA
jgi:hypothetical protein